MGDVCMEMGDYSKAKAVYSKAYKMAKAQKNPSESCHSMKRRLTKGLSAVKVCLQLMEDKACLLSGKSCAEQIDDWQLVCRLLEQLGDLHW